MQKKQRMHNKALICILGLVLLLVFSVTAALVNRKEETGETKEAPRKEPVVRVEKNLWILETYEDGISMFRDGEICYVSVCEDARIPEDCREQLADVVYEDERVKEVICKREKISGKVLAAGVTGVKIEGKGFVPFSEEVKGYCLYGETGMCTFRDIRIGYDFTDFVMEEGEICGILQVKDAAMDHIRVLVGNSDYSEFVHKELRITCDTDYTVTYVTYEAEQTIEKNAGEELYVGRDREWASCDRILIRPSALTGKVTLLNVNRSQGVPSYRGTMEITLKEEGFSAVNELLLEEYLYSVLPSEMPASYPEEALKAQAICARTYAYRYMKQAGRGEYGAHVDDSVNFQVYNNVREQEKTTQAVKETFGQILLADGAPAQTYYYSTSCGAGTDADVWQTEEGNSPEYLKASVIAEESQINAGNLETEEGFCEFILKKPGKFYEAGEPWFRWSCGVDSIDMQRILQRMRERYERNPDQVLTLAGDGQYVSSKIQEWKHILDIRIQKRGPGGVVRELLIETEKDTYRILTEYNIRYILCGENTEIIKQDGSIHLCSSLLPSGYFLIEPIREEEEVCGFTLTGGGYGHGVGMSQNGAKQMAFTGMSASGILSFFYGNCQLENIYDTE